MKPIEHKEKTLHYRLEYFTSFNMKYYHAGKSWPRVTSCILYINETPVLLEKVTKHYQDKDDLKLALTLVTKKALKKVVFKDIRKYFWGELFNQFKTMNEENEKI